MKNINRNGLKIINGDKYWFLNNKRHRDDGPAVEMANGNKEWYLEGVEYSEDEFNTIQFSKKLKSELPSKDQQPKKIKI